MSISKKEINIKLLTDFLNKKNYLNFEIIQSIIEVSLEMFDKGNNELYQINSYLVDGKQSYEGLYISYVLKNDIYKLIVDGNILDLNYAQIRELIVGLIDLLEDTLPLGSVVKLKNEYIQKIAGNEQVQEAEFVIVNRYVFFDGTKIFIPYSGIVYPIGFGGSSETFHFSPALIEKVLHRGYSDEKNDTYMYLIKNELIVEKNMHSFGFATKEEMEEFNKVKNGKK